MVKHITQKSKPSGISRAKSCILSHKRQIAQVFLALMICGSMAGLQVYAAGSGASDVSSITAGVSSLESFVRRIVIGIGFVVALFGGVTLRLGFAQDNPDDQSKGVKLLIGGGIIVSVGVFIQLFGGKV